MSNRRRQLSSVHRQIARNEPRERLSAFLVEMPLERLTVKQLDQAGAALLPAREVCPVCLGSREVQQQVTDNLTVTAPCAECGGRGYYVEGA